MCRGVMYHNVEEYAKFEEEVTCGLKNDMGNLVNFTGTLTNLEIRSLRYFFVQGIECLS